MNVIETPGLALLPVQFRCK